MSVRTDLKVVPVDAPLPDWLVVGLVRVVRPDGSVWWVKPPVVSVDDLR